MASIKDSTASSVSKAEPVSAMNGTQQIELTIRTATLIKSLSDLVGVEDPRIAKMMFAVSVDQYAALGKFIESVQVKQPTARTGAE